MNLSELIQKRQSDRKYESRPVSREMAMKCLEAARLAPSACNSQPWKFVVVDDVALLPQMGAAAAGMRMNGFAREVPVIVAVVLEKMNLTARIGSVIKDKEYSLLDVGIAWSIFACRRPSWVWGLASWLVRRKESEKAARHQRKARTSAHLAGLSGGGDPQESAQTVGGDE